MRSCSELSFEFRQYRRPFRRVLKTKHGTWTCREGIVLKLSDAAGRVGFGEIAPLPWFGTETQAQALTFCQRLPAVLSADNIFSILPTLPTCKFGFEVAFNNLAERPHSPDLETAHCCALLPAGPAALSSWSALWAMGHRTFKWKIGVAPVSTELAWLSQLMAQLPLGAKLRLDANGGLNELAAQHWLEQCDRLGHRIEFIEQPLPPSRFEDVIKLDYRYKSAIALDESVTTLDQLKAHYFRGWRGIYVVKAAILGSPSRLLQFCQDYPIDVVISSVFETDIGRQALLDLAADLKKLLPQAPQRVLGMGTQQWLPNDGLDDPDWEALWQRLS
ncbi:MAG: o-succinylbenzoate synthase [Phormidesmis sp.]